LDNRAVRLLVLLVDAKLEDKGLATGVEVDPTDEPDSLIVMTPPVAGSD
jgi:hypothetical protein